MSASMIEARYLQAGAVVRLSDGRLGWFWRGTGKDPYRVMLGQSSVSIRAATELEVIRYPAELASDYVASLSETARLRVIVAEVANIVENANPDWTDDEGLPITPDSFHDVLKYVTA